jgi:hypothetical protein
MPYDQLIEIATISSTSVSPPPWLQITIGIFGERLNIFVAVRPAAATTLTGCRLRMTLPSYSLPSTRIFIPRSVPYNRNDMDSIRSSINNDLFSGGYNKDCIVSPEEVRLAVHKLKAGIMTVVWDCLLITTYMCVLICSFTSLCCLPHYFSMVLHLVIYHRAQLYLYQQVKIPTCVFQPTTAALLIAKSWVKFSKELYCLAFLINYASANGSLVFNQRDYQILCTVLLKETIAYIISITIARIVA